MPPAKTDTATIICHLREKNTSKLVLLPDGYFRLGVKISSRDRPTERVRLDRSCTHASIVHKVACGSFRTFRDPGISSNNGLHAWRFPLNSCNFHGANLACPDVSLQALGNQNNPPILVFAEDPGVEFRRATPALDRF